MSLIIFVIWVVSSNAQKQLLQAHITSNALELAIVIIVNIKLFVS